VNDGKDLGQSIILWKRKGQNLTPDFQKIQRKSAAKMYPKKRSIFYLIPQEQMMKEA
jgi:hypothetical protein